MPSTETIRLSPNSWLKIIPKGFKVSDNDYDKLWDIKPKKREQYKIYGKAVNVPRYLQLFGTAIVKVSGKIFTSKKPTNKTVKRALSYAGKDYNTVLVNWYPTCEDYIGFHADVEKGIDQSVPIMSISLGAERRFVIKEKKTKKTVLSIILEDETVILMGGDFQKEYKHALPKMRGIEDCERINLTIRRYN